ncbi:MAG: DSBA oxidoreductase [Candidatus Falkowbacteria bacterium GW2011_GWC2_38_22]|uniref:DSBA oxidoreductase n=1 Tax=Candidatus Falkowbacteria bacterium GW2011_GWE1_38_31 TaxID=1618638 RepID=A0A0G0MZN2_9BACT|nr:MAG: DSBA oxidoreductase [Candidatus Falkowbacteria bacterium GW2011_GWF2_38_1205]KKQ61555.1 MAG: DSBA oxidoreductase [Candidatus Falkowbacteria bacterium GW2011_GWC2_38_22]KKQ63552.1 MAG: DSBA oxidoreductase [Candidatus Falkowbacteria bacterium GW2011_GWF1_38_22]KKQ65704.1 MAG: DSBA oxidoreductase [Candidatus Falkowbacteria bacterium GW2011_GWE2_38_254]KKQ70321.1 MAG: DSBA oxidoreductase [Candidatus Falkowbacteria bacterium GW2011_GWE1_38_31]KKQ72826.1 MAG: DSBA oxidoreductase [Candidatus 
MNNPLKPWYKKWWGVLALLALLFFISIFFAFVFLVINSRDTAPSSGINPLLTQKVPALAIGTEKNYWLGSANPKITIVEFGDFACSYCQKSFSKIREISQLYKNDIKYIYRDYPVVSDYSAKLALAARCAGEQGLFWIMHDKLYINQGISTDQEILNHFKQTGGNEAKFSTCYDANKYLPEIEKDLSDGQSLNITGTPTWFVNGQRLEGDVPYEYFINLISNILGT